MFLEEKLSQADLKKTNKQKKHGTHLTILNIKYKKKLHK